MQQVVAAGRYLMTRPGMRRAVQLTAGALLLGSLLMCGVAWNRSALEAPPATWLLLDRQGSFLAELGQNDRQGYGYWPVEELPPRVVAATLAIEDRRFWSHPGVDPLAVLRAVWQNLSNQQRVSGASTIAMQVARMQTPADRTYASKAIEATTSLMMTARHGRRQVLAHYLRLVPYGNNIHGIAYAARRYLDKPVADLSWAEIAFLSAIPQSPSRMNPYDFFGRQRAVRRGKHILARLREQAVISPEDYELALQQIDAIRVPDRQARQVSAMHAILKIEQLVRQGRLGNADDHMLKTTLNLTLQEKVTNLAEAMLEQHWRAKGAGNAAVIVLDKNSAEVLAWVGSGNYFDERYSGSIDYTQVKRSSGSTLKPFIYALGLERGDITPASVLADIPVSGVPVRNSDGRFLGPILPRQALASSRNVPAVELVRSIGIEENYAFLRKLGLHRAEESAGYYGLGIALGALTVTLEELVHAYTALANDGVEKNLRWFKQRPASGGRRLMSTATARLITQFLSDPNARLPTFARMGTTEYPFPAAVKTGTSQGYRDAWTVAYSKRYLVGVWTGDPDHRPMNRLGGAASAADLVQRILMMLHNDQEHGLHDLSFPPPQGYQQVRLCSTSGKLAGNACEPSYQEWLAPEQVPTEYDQSHRLLMIDNRSGLPSDVHTPVRFRQLKNVLTLPPRFAVWAKQSGLDNVSQVSQAEASATSVGMQQVELEIISPRDGARFIRNPETPTNASSIELNVSSSCAIPQVVWYVDGKPYRVSDYPYAARLQLERGSHLIQARVPLTEESSEGVRIYVE